MMELPDEWRLLTPHQLVGEDKSRLVIGPFGSSLKTSDYEAAGVPLIFVRDIRSGDFATPRAYVNEAKASELAAHRVEPGDVLVTKMGDPPGDSAIYSATRTGIITADCIRLRPVAEVDPRFVAYALKSPQVREQILTITSGVAQLKVSLGRFRAGVQIPVPMLAEQRQIVEILEDHLSRLDAGQRSLRDADVRFSSLAESLLASSPEMTGTTKCAVGSVLASPLVNGRSVPTAEDGFPVLRLTAMKDGVIDLAERKIGHWTADEASKFRVEHGDVFISRGNGSLSLVGRAARVVDYPDSIAFPDTMIRMRLDESRLRPDFLTLIWNARGTRSQIERTARTTAGIYKVNQKDLQRIIVPVPTLTDQARMVERINAQMDARTRTRDAVMSAQQRGQRLRRSLLSAAFSGRLTGASSDTERIEELVAAGA